MVLAVFPTTLVFGTARRYIHTVSVGFALPHRTFIMALPPLAIFRKSPRLITGAIGPAIDAFPGPRHRLVWFRICDPDRAAPPVLDLLPFARRQCTCCPRSTHQQHNHKATKQLWQSPLPTKKAAQFNTGQLICRRLHLSISNQNGCCVSVNNTRSPGSAPWGPGREPRRTSACAQRCRGVCRCRLPCIRARRARSSPGPREP